MNSTFRSPALVDWYNFVFDTDRVAGLDHRRRRRHLGLSDEELELAQAPDSLADTVLQPNWFRGRCAAVRRTKLTLGWPPVVPRGLGVRIDGRANWLVQGELTAWIHPDQTTC
eukprot:scaffold3226_cov160-Amphora_coffeaeformis.AAC.25